MSEFRTVPVMAGTNLRRGTSTKSDPGEDNIMGLPLRKDDYLALVQCAAQDVKPDKATFNYWWVLIDTPQGRGWVSAVRITEGDNNQAITGVNKAVTVYEAPWTDGPTTTVHVVHEGAPVYLGGSTRSDPSYAPTRILAGPCQALVQCGGQDITFQGQSNFRWVLIETPDGGFGWISAVYLTEGPNHGPIPGVPSVPTVNSGPPDLLP